MKCKCICCFRSAGGLFNHVPNSIPIKAGVQGASTGNENNNTWRWFPGFLNHTACDGFSFTELCRHVLYVNEPARLMNLFFAHRANMLVTQLYIHATNSLQMAASALLLLHLRTFRRDAGQMTDCVRELSPPRQFFGTAALFSHGPRVHMIAPICPPMPVSFQFYTSDPAAATAGGTVHPILMNKSFLQSLQIWQKNDLEDPL